MNIGILGTGMVGQIIGARLAALGHSVTIGTRDVAQTLARTTPDNYGNPAFGTWHAQHPEVSVATFADAAASAELIFNCTAGNASVEALHMAGEANLNGKVLIDLSNALDFSQGMPPSLSVCNTDSMGEQIQRAFPQVKVVKTLNTMNAHVMVNPALLAGDHDVFVSGNDAAAKAQVTEILRDCFGWQSIIDLGDIKTARGTEMLLPIWLNLMGVLQTPMFNFKVVR